MTLVSDIITDAFRTSNLLALGTTPTSDQQTEALRFLNRLIKSVFGNELGEQLTAFPIGSTNISKPTGYPWWNTVPDGEWFVPKNTRLMLNLNQSIDIYLHPDPDDGCRFALNDVAQSFGDHPINVYGNGRLIESATSIALNTAGYEAEWFYRNDLANWVKYAPITLTDAFPFPEEFDDYFIALLAMRLNPTYGVQMDPQTKAGMDRSKVQMQAQYKQMVPQQSELALVRMPRTSQDRSLWGNSYWLYQPNAMFNKGWPW